MAAPSAKSSRDGAASAVLIALAFVSPGAWLLAVLPPIPIAAALHLATVGAWLIAAGLGLVRMAALDKRLLWAVGAVAGAVALSYAAGGAWLQVALYGLFTNMSLLQWLAFPVAFVLAAALSVERRRVETGLLAVVALGALIAAVMAFQEITTNANWVFGTTAYSITALAAVIPVAAGLAAGRTGWARGALYGAAALIAVVLFAFSGSTMGALASVFAALASAAVHLLGRPGRSARVLGVGTAAVATLMVAGLLVAEVPAVGVLDRVVAARADRNTLTRVYLWQGAQRMFAAKPLLGFGPAGYRTAAADYLPPEALQFGADVEGNTDPTVYSPQSPHSLLWDIATQLGLAGLVAFAALLAAWATVLAQRLREGPGERRLRGSLAAGFLTALFVLMVNPAAFPIGLFAPVAAGLAVAPLAPERDRKKRVAQQPGPRRIAALAAAGALVVLLALWLGVGETMSYTAGSNDPVRSIQEYEAALRVVPGDPIASRRLLDTRLAVASSEAEERAAQQAVDRAPAYMRAFAPNLVNFAAMALNQAERTGRTDLDWERATLAEAGKRLPPIPSAVAERLHLALLEKDAAGVRAAVPDAERWGKPYPPTATYLEQAKTLR